MRHALMVLADGDDTPLFVGRQQSDEVLTPRRADAWVYTSRLNAERACLQWFYGLRHLPGEFRVIVLDFDDVRHWMSKDEGEAK